jgi:hypothetical protein
VPVTVREPSEEVEQLLDAVTANLQRQDLSIVEEARAFQRMRQQGKPIKQIAAELGVSQKLVSQRIGMLVLPAYVLNLIGDAGIAPGHIPTLVEMAKVSPNLATGMATVIVEKDISASKFAASPFKQVAQGHVPELDIWIVGRNATIALSSVRERLNDEDNANLMEIAKLRGSDKPNAVNIDLQPGIAYGCVYCPPESSDPWDAKWAICDADWLVGAVRASIHTVLEQARELARAAGHPEADAPAPAVSEQEAGEAKREERQAELKQRLVANAVNQNLGAELFSAVDSLALDRELALRLARMVIRDDARALFLAGMRFCLPQFVKEVESKNGPAKLAYELPDRDEQAKLVWQFIERGDSGETVIARLMQVLGMAGLADDTAVSQSNRPGVPQIARLHADYIAGLVGPKLPAPIRERLDEQAAREAEWEAKLAATKAEAEKAAEEQYSADEDEYLERETEANFPQDDED